MNKDEVVAEIRRYLYGTYTSGEELKERLSGFIHDWKQDLPEDFCTLAVIWNDGCSNHWILRAESPTEVTYIVLEHASITERRKELVNEGLYPNSLFIQKELDRLIDGQIPFLKKELANKDAENQALHAEIERMKQESKTKSPVIPPSEDLDMFKSCLSALCTTMEEQLVVGNEILGSVKEMVDNIHNNWGNLEYLESAKKSVEGILWAELFDHTVLGDSEGIACMLNDKIKSLLSVYPSPLGHSFMMNPSPYNGMLDRFMQEKGGELQYK